MYIHPGRGAAARDPHRVSERESEAQGKQKATQQQRVHERGLMLVFRKYQQQQTLALIIDVPKAIILDTLNANQLGRIIPYKNILRFLSKIFVYFRFMTQFCPVLVKKENFKVCLDRFT